ncbi:MAG: PIG-L family deacetylase [Vicinamibacterales bacterium]
MADRPLRLAIVAPVALPVPPPRSGSIESLTALLADGLADAGHDVTLFATGGSRTRARLHAILPLGYREDPTLWPWEMCELCNLAAAVERAASFDLIHYQAQYVPLAIPFTSVCPVPMTQTVHHLPGPSEIALWSRCRSAPFIAVSRAQATALAPLAVAGVVHHGVDLDDYVHDGRVTDDYLLFLGRFTEGKGVLQAIELARRTGHHLRLAAADNEYFRSQVAPLVDNDRVVSWARPTCRTRWPCSPAPAPSSIPSRRASPSGSCSPRRRRVARRSPPCGAARWTRSWRTASPGWSATRSRSSWPRCPKPCRSIAPASARVRPPGSAPRTWCAATRRCSRSWSCTRARGREVDHRQATGGLLAVLAHPDDESLACGGLLAWCASTGVRTSLLCLSRGELRDPDGDGARPARVEELEAASHVLGLQDVILRAYRDGYLPFEDPGALEADIRDVITRLHPDLVVTFDADGLYWHPDHVAVHERTTQAIRALGEAAPALYYVTMPAGSMRAAVDAVRGPDAVPAAVMVLGIDPDAFGSEAPAPTVTIDAGAFARRKLAALRCHRSQVDGDVLDRLPEADAARVLGVEHYRRAEVGARGETLIDRLGRPH